MRLHPRVHLVRCVVISRSAVCVLHAGGSAANAQLAPSSVISAAVAVHLVRCIIISRSAVSRLPASVCGRIRQRSACCMAGE